MSLSHTVSEIYGQKVLRQV